MQVKQLDDATIAKLTLSDEPESSGSPEDYREMLAITELVYGEATIPIPAVHDSRVLPNPSVANGAYIVMENIPGTRFDAARPTLSLWSKIRASWILRRYIRQLRQLRSTLPGPLGHSALTCVYCAGRIRQTERRPIRRRRGAHRSRERAGTYRIDGTPVPRGYETAKPLVFTQNDLNMRKMILGETMPGLPSGLSMGLVRILSSVLRVLGDEPCSRGFHERDGSTVLEIRCTVYYGGSLFRMAANLAVAHRPSS